MKKAKEIVKQYHSFSDEVNYKRQLLRMCNDTSRLIESCAAKDFRECGTSIPRNYFEDVKKKLIENGYKILNENFGNPETVSFIIQW